MKAIKSLLFMTLIALIDVHAQPVHPGDFNMDGVANIADVLFWGLAHGNTGPIRNNATTNWTPQPAENWNQSVNAVNNKYQDGDGNGLIDTFDLTTLRLNYDKSHNDIIQPTIEDKHEVWVDYDYAIHGADKMHIYQIDPKGFDELHGISFTFDYSEFASVAMIQLDTTDSWWGADGTAVQVLHEDDAKLHVALTRTDRTNASLIDKAIIKIVICEPIASLTDSPKVHVKNGELITADEKRYDIEEHTYAPPLSGPKCIELWNGENCHYENGIINHKEALLNQHGQGFCFEGKLYGDNTASISMGCGDNINDIYNVCYLDTLWFYAKSDIRGIGKSFEFYISDTYGNDGYAISVNNLDTTYQRIAVTVDTLRDNDCALRDIEWIHFRKAQNTSDFHIYIEDIKADWARAWKPDGCYYQDATLNEEEAYNGRYCYERVVDEDDDWYHSVLGLWCEDAPYDFSTSDEIQFYAKADKEGKSFNVYLSENYGWDRCYNEINVNDYIEGGSLTTDYRLVSIPIDSLRTDDCTYINVDHIHFFNHDDTDFKFYIDDINIYSNNNSCESLPLVVSTDTPEITNPALTLYPNPVSQSVLNIQINHTQITKADLIITNLQGQVLHRSNVLFNMGQHTISRDIAPLPSGMYIVQIKTDNEQVIADKFIKMK